MNLLHIILCWCSSSQPASMLPFDEEEGGQHRASLHPALLPTGWKPSSSRNWIHASGLDLDKDVPPSPNPFTGVWWAQMNGPGGGTHRRASRFSTDKHCSLLSSSSLLQLTHVSWVFLLSSATLSHFPYVFAALLWSFLVSVPVSKHSSSSSLLTLWLVSLSFLTPPGHQPQVSIQQVSLLQS